jgi:hypothetical protein
MLGAKFSNLYGHFEDIEIVELHQRILKDNGQTWLVNGRFLPTITEPVWRRIEHIIWRRNAEHYLWGFKDPRVCLFVMLWKHLLPDSKVLLVYRHFSDSTYSLERRQSTELLSNPHGAELMYRRFWEEPDYALRMWLTHNEALLAFARAYPEDTLAVSLDMVQNGFPVVKAINQRWDLALDEVSTSEVFDPDSTDRRPGRQPIADRRLIGRIDASWESLERLSRQTELMVSEPAV